MIGFRLIGSELAHEWRAYREDGELRRRLSALIDKRDDLSDLEDKSRWAFWSAIVLAVVSVVLAVVTFAADFLGWIGIPLTAIGVLGTVRQTFLDRRRRRVLRENVQKRLNDLKLIDYRTFGTIETVNAIRLNKAYIDSGYEKDLAFHGFGAWSRDLNDWLMSPAAREIRAVYSEDFYEGPPVARETIRPFLNFQRTATNRLYHNGLKLKLDSDLVRNDDGAFPLRVHIQKTDYLATLSTNDLSFQQLIERKSRRTLYDGISAFLSDRADGTFLYRGLAGSDCANQIGVSTLAFTSDGYLLLVDQSHQNLQSAGLVAPSGSGSLDLEDLPAGQTEFGLLDWLDDVCCRELREELGIQPSVEFSDKRRASLESVSVLTQVIGFALYLHRGGKPEFFYLARLSCSADELNRIAAYTRQEDSLSNRFPKQKDYRIRDMGDPISLQLMRICENLRGGERLRMSFPLELQLAMVEHASTSQAEVIEEFFRNEFPAS